MGLKIFCLNLSHCLECVYVCVCAQAHECVRDRCVCVRARVGGHVSVSVRQFGVVHKRQYCFKPSFLVSSFWYYFILYCSKTQDFSTICDIKEGKNTNISDIQSCTE